MYKEIYCYMIKGEKKEQPKFHPQEFVNEFIMCSVNGTFCNFKKVLNFC